jgi:hypothetical protein
MFLLFVLAVVLGLTRLAGVTTEAFQAISHVFVGGLIGAWFLGLVLRSEIGYNPKRAVYCGVLALALSCLEVYAFIQSKEHPPCLPIPACGCGCMQTGECNCKNCVERTADPNWKHCK